MPKILISDSLNDIAKEVFENNKIEVDIITDLKPEDLKVVLKTLKKENQQAKVIGKLKKKRRNNPPITFV